MRVLSIAGQGRSGSTLLERVLAELPGVCALGEAAHVWQDRLHEAERCGCGAWFAHCEFWRAVGQRAFGGWHNVDRRRVVSLWSTVATTRTLPRLVSPAGDRLARIREFADYHTRVYAAAAEVTGARLVIDSTKYPALPFCLRWATDLDLRVVHLVRDPRGVAYSWTKQLARPEADAAAMVPRYRPARSALRWNAHNAAIDVLARLGGEGANRQPRRVPVRRIRYEDFVVAPRQALRSLAAFAGLEPALDELAYLGEDHVDLGTIHSASGNPMRFVTGRVRLRHDDAWRAGLPAGQRWLVSAICAPALVAYGYPLAVRSSE
jgi:sulfotransferase family protein